MHPPRLAELLVTVLVDEPEREFLLGDLSEQFAASVRAGSRLAAWRWYWSQAIRGTWQARQIAVWRKAAARARRAAEGRGRRLDMAALFREFTLAVRTSLKSPAYSVIVVLTLALAIGANTLLFSIANPLLIRPLPITDAGHLGWIWQVNAPSEILTAERYFDGVGSAFGRTITMHGRGVVDTSVRIVGVVADTKNSQGTKTSPQIWLPFDQQPLQSMTFVIRSESPDTHARDVQIVMRRLNPAVAISQPVTMAKQVRDVLADDSILTGLFSGFALLALALAAAGLYGVISYSVGQRQREIGIRLALGARPATIHRMVMFEGLKVTGLGVVVGLGLAALLAQGTASFLVGITPHDPQTFGVVVAILLIVACLAIWSPARRAMRVDPVTTLRTD